MTSPLRIGEAAALLGVSRKTLRHYEKRGLIRPSRAENGYRGYSPEHIAQLQRIRQLQSLGLTLAQIKRVLRASGNNQVWGDVLEALHTEITAEIVELEARRKRIEELLTEGAPSPLETTATLLPSALRVQAYLEDHLSPPMWQREQAFYAVLARYHRTEREASMLAVADHLLTCTQAPPLRTGESADPGDWPATIARRPGLGYTR
jgi:DNA-binding transcriptional MerR regulator